MYWQHDKWEEGAFVEQFEGAAVLDVKYCSLTGTNLTFTVENMPDCELKLRYLDLSMMLVSDWQDSAVKNSLQQSEEMDLTALYSWINLAAVPSSSSSCGLLMQIQIQIQ